MLSNINRGIPKMLDVVCLNDNYSTTRLVTTTIPVADRYFKKNSLKCEGGLRTKGYFKKSYKDKPLISIITVVYNGEKDIEETIKSVVNQTYDNVEYIIIDGNSTDNTVNIIKKYEDKIDYWISEKDKGIYDAMNKGINLFHGRFLNFMNASDIFSGTDILENINKKILEEKIFPEFIYGNAIIFDEDGSLIKELKPLKFSKTFLNMFSTRVVCHQAVFVNKDKVCFYDTSFKIKGDLNWYYDLLKNIEMKNIHKIDLNICNYSLGGVSGQNVLKNYKEQVKVMYKQNNIIEFIAFLPFLLIPFIFKLKKKILDILRK